MRPKLALCTLAAAAGLLASLAPAETFSFTGKEPATGIVITFSLDPANAVSNGSGFVFAATPTSLNGGPAVDLDYTLSPVQSPYFTGDVFNITGGGLDETYLVDAGNPFDDTTFVLTGDPTTDAIPTINPGTYAGVDQTGCLASLRIPSLVPGRLSTLAMLQMPVSTCGDPVSLVVTPASVSATPEPSTLTLLGTGVLGAIAAVRRRFLN